MSLEDGITLGGRGVPGQKAKSDLAERSAVDGMMLRDGAWLDASLVDAADGSVVYQFEFSVLSSQSSARNGREFHV